MFSTPNFTAAEARSRDTFLALMWAMSYPGRSHTLPGDFDPFLLIGEALLDLETSFYTPDALLADELAKTGARSESLESADYIFIPALDDFPVESLSRARIGTMVRPDQSATVITSATFSDGIRLRLTGPGISGSTELHIGGLPESFWNVRERSRRFPLGWDAILLDGRDVIAIPRSTDIEVIG